jgi:phospholipid/cholesterol/gamma-HCH transport system substrate-binding protein
MREPSKAWTRELQVGIFIFASILVIAAFSFKLTDTPMFRRGTQLTTFIDDATGVFRNSKVKLAGIDIGVISRIELDRGRAKITLLIDEHVSIPEGAQIVPRPLGILGDKYLEVVVPKELAPGATMNEPKKTSMVSPVLNAIFGAKAYADNVKEGDVLPSKNSATSVDDVTKKLGAIAEDLKEVSESIRAIVNGDVKKDSTLYRTLKNTEALTQNLDAITEENRKELRTMVKSLSRLSVKLEQSFDSFDQSRIKDDIHRMANAAGNLSKSLENVEKITNRIERGEGTLGKLVNDETTVRELNRALSAINTTVDRARRTQILVDMTSIYLTRVEESETFVGLDLFPREDSGYSARVIFDTRGRERDVVTQSGADGSTPTVTTRTRSRDLTALKYSLQYVRRFSDFSVRLGLFESAGGLALDWDGFNRSIGFTVESFDFTRKDENPNLRVTGRIKLFSYFVLSAGGDQLIALPASSRYSRSFFVGVGIRFADDDLKTVALLPGVF